MTAATMPTRMHADTHPLPSFEMVFRAHLKTLYYTLRRERWVLLVLYALAVTFVVTAAYKSAKATLEAKLHKTPIATCIQASHKPNVQVSFNVNSFVVGPAIRKMTVQDAQGGLLAECSTLESLDSVMMQVNGIPTVGQSSNTKTIVSSTPLNATITSSTPSAPALPPSAEEQRQVTETQREMAEFGMQFARTMNAVWLLALIGAVTFRMWRGDSVSKRVYFLSMPVQRGQHTVLKALAGWCWFVGAMLLTALVFLAITLLVKACFAYFGVGELLLQPDSKRIISDWVGPFTVMTIFYLLVSTLAVGTKSPGYWLIGLALGMMVLPIVFYYLKWKPVGDAIRTVWFGQYGLSHIMPIFPPQFPPDLTHWWTATAIWMGIAMAAFLCAAYARRPVGLRS